MAKTWRRSPVGAPKEPRPPEKGGKRNIYKEVLEEDDVLYADEDFLTYEEDKEEDNF
jgi:hypothetical protein